MIKMMLNDWLIRAAFLEVLFLSIATPQTKIAIMQAINPQLVAIRFLVGNVSIIVFTLLYEKYSNTLYKYYPVMMITRTTIFVTIIALVLCDSMSLVAYYICELLTASLLSKSIQCCCARMKRFMYNGPNREKFDNYKHLGVAIAGTFGNGISLIGIPAKLAWVFLMLSILVDAWCSVMQYREIKLKNKQ